MSTGPATRISAGLAGVPTDVDLVVVATPNRSHVAMARLAIEAGLPVVVDKPLAATSAEGRALVDEARRRGVPGPGRRRRAPVAGISVRAAGVVTAVP